MRYLLILLALISVFTLTSCGKDDESTLENPDTQLGKNFDSPALLEVENNISSPEKELWDD